MDTQNKTSCIQDTTNKNLPYIKPSADTLVLRGANIFATLSAEGTISDFEFEDEL